MTPRQKIDYFFQVAAAELEELRHDYFIIGSSAMILSGIELEDVGDIDLLTSLKDADFLKNKWEKNMLDYTPGYRDLFRSNFARFDLEKVQVEVMGNLEIFKGQHWVPLVINRFQIVNINGCRVKVPTLKEQYRIFKFFGRLKDIKKAKILEKYL